MLTGIELFEYFNLQQGGTCMKYCLCLLLAGNHTIAVIKGKEEYESFKASLANAIRDVNSLVKDGYMIVDGHTVNLDIYLGGDYKVNELSCAWHMEPVLIMKFQIVLTYSRARHSGKTWLHFPLEDYVWVKSTQSFATAMEFARATG